MAAPLLGRRPKRREAAPDRMCLTPGCGTMMPSWKWLCDACFGSLPYPRKREICEARQAKEPSRIYGLSRSAADWIVAQREKRAEA